MDGSSANPGNNPPAVSLRLEVLKERTDFLRASRGSHVAMPGFVMQMRKRQPGEAPDPAAVRVGFTCSKKVGNAVARNRAKRRLREIARLGLPVLGCPGHDYVLIGRRAATATLPFSQLQADLARALSKLHGPAA